MTAISPGELGDPAVPKTSGAALTALAALGIVFGDIGTSPLYTLKTAFDFLGGEPEPDRILGMLSLVTWTLFLITSVKYVMVAMSIDNEGEGGILALMSLLGMKHHRRPLIVVARCGSTTSPFTSATKAFCIAGRSLSCRTGRSEFSGRWCEMHRT
jgi:K+ transporter